MAYRTERILITTAVLLVGLGLIQMLNRGAQAAGGALPPALLWLMALVLVVLAGAGALWVSGGVPAEAPVGPKATGAPVRGPVVIAGRAGLLLRMAVPMLMAAGFVLFMPLFDNGPVQAAVLVVAGASFGTLYWAQAHAVYPGDRYFWPAQVVLNVLSHLTAFVVFSVIYGLKVRALLSGTAVGLVTGLLIYEMLWRDINWHRAMRLPVEGRRSTLALLTVASSVVAGELTWGLNYWAALPALVGGAFLLVTFYVLFGLTAHYADRTLTRNILIEFSVVTAVSLGIILASAFSG
jgi:hypothetical protein